MHKWSLIVILFAFSVAVQAQFTDPFNDSVWATDPEERGYTLFGPLNGGGSRTYAVTDNELQVTLLTGARNSGDVLWVNPLGTTEQFATADDTVEVDVTVNAGIAEIGDYTYCAGPGIYFSDSQTELGYGDSAANCGEVYLAHQDTEETAGKFRVIAYKSTGGGGYRSANLQTADDVWAFGTWVHLKVVYQGDIGGAHTYEFSYDAGAGEVVLGTLDWPVRLAFAGPFAAYSYYNAGGCQNDVPNWATIDNFSPVPEILVPVELSVFEAD